MSNPLALSFQISATTAGLARATKQVEKSLKAMERETKKTQQELAQIKFFTGVTASLQTLKAAAFGVRRAALGLNFFVDAASSAEQEIQKTTQVFGAFGEEVKAFAKTTSQIGISEVAALSATSTFGNLFTALGGGAEEAASLSIGLTQVAADLAAFANTSTDQAIFALSSGLRGEQEPLKKYGLVLSEAVLKQEALNAGLVQTTKGTLPPYIRSLAAALAVFNQTKNSQNQAIREAQQYQTQLKRIRAVFQDVAQGIGNVLQPAFKAVATAIEENIPAIRKFIGTLLDGFKAWSESGGIDRLIEGVNGLIRGFQEFWGIVEPIIVLFLAVLTVAWDVLSGIAVTLTQASDRFEAWGQIIGVGTAALLGYYAIQKAVTIYNYAMALSFKVAKTQLQGLLAATGLGLAIVGIGLLAEYFIAAGSSVEEFDESASALPNTGSALVDTSARIKAAIDSVKSSFTGAGAEAKTFAELIELPNRVNVTVKSVEDLGKAAAKLATDLGGVEFLPEEAVSLYGELQKRIEYYNSGLNSTDSALKNIIRKREQLLSIIEREREKIKAVEEAEKNRLQYLEDASKLYTELATDASDKSRQDYLDRQKKIATEVAKLEGQILQAKKNFDIKALNSAKQRLKLAEKARAESLAMLKSDVLDSAGFSSDDIRRQETTADKLQSAFDLFASTARLFTGEEKNNLLRNVLSEQAEYTRQISEDLAKVRGGIQDGKDIRTQEGLNEYFRVATQQEDPAIEENRKQLKELQQIKELLRKNGLDPVTILGAA